MYTQQQHTSSPHIPKPQEIHWYAVHTRSQHERKVVRQLTDKGITNFLPLQPLTRRWSDRTKVVEMPLFPGYVFVQMRQSPESRLPVLQASGVAGFVGVRGWGSPIPDKQIEDLQTLLSRKVPFECFPFLREGRRVRIRGGCLEGIEGILIQRISDRGLVLSVEPIQRSLVICLEDYDVEPV